MCLKVGKDEMDTMRNLMRLSLLILVSDTFDVDIDEVSGDARLVEDMKLDKIKANRLSNLIAEYFDGLQIDLNETPTVDTLLDKIVETQMH
jgi:hypothetical protein